STNREQFEDFNVNGQRPTAGHESSTRYSHSSKRVSTEIISDDNSNSNTKSEMTDNKEPTPNPDIGTNMSEEEKMLKDLISKLGPEGVKAVLSKLGSQTTN